MATFVNDLGLPALSTNGFVWIGDAATPTVPVAALLTAGTGINITNGAGSITIAATGTTTPFTNVTGATQAMTTNNGYFADNAGTQIAFTLPTTSAVGDVLYLDGVGAAGWAITYTTGQYIVISGVSSTVTTGNVTSALFWNGLTLRCQVANTGWIAERVNGSPSVT